MSLYLLLCMETHARRMAFESSGLNQRVHRERTSMLPDMRLLKHDYRLRHLLEHGFDLGYTALLEL
jgi:hypothetical protein